MLDIKDLEIIHFVLSNSLETNPDKKVSNLRLRINLLIEQNKKNEEYQETMKKYQEELSELVKENEKLLTK